MRFSGVFEELFEARERVKDPQKVVLVKDER